MKKISKFNTIILMSSLLTVLGLYSCSEDVMDDINKDINHTTDVPAKFILADVITSTAFYNVGGDLNTYTATYIEHEVGTHNQLYRAEHREGEPYLSSTFNNTWSNLYITLKNARIVVEKCSEGGPQEGNSVTKGMGEVLEALTSAILTDMYGDVPWTEAAPPKKNPEILNPKIDKQKDIYTNILALLDQAIIDLQGKDLHASGSAGAYDLLYNGNASKWLKFAYGLKARYTMRLLKRSTNVQNDLEKVIEYVNASFQSADEQAAFNIYNASNLNPLFDFQWSRDGLAASKSMSEKLIERNDPRIRRVFVDADWMQVTGPDDENFFMAPNGKNVERQYYYNTSVFVFSQIAPTLLLSYHELLFLKAEAYCRLNRPDLAEPILKEAVIAGIKNTEVNVSAAMNAPTVLGYGGLGETSDPITETEASEYFENNVLPLFNANPLKETMIQKYIAFFGASGESPEAYNDYRRLTALGENFIELKNPKNAEGLFPLRCPYGADDVTANPNVQEAYGDGRYVYTENVWWAGGTR
jgi:hypothetical protein